MTSINVSLSGNSSSLSTSLYPEIELDEQFDYSCCLLDLSIQIPSDLRAVLTADNNTLVYYHKDTGGHIEVPTGDHSMLYITNLIQAKMKDLGVSLAFTFNRHTMKYQIKTAQYVLLDFTKPRSMAEILGFDPQIIQDNVTTVADHSLGSLNVETVRVNCDLVNGSFRDGVSTHTLHEFRPKEFTNYKMIERPRNLIYLPIVKQRINSVHITVTNQNGQPIILGGGRGGGKSDVKIYCRISIKRN